MPLNEIITPQEIEVVEQVIGSIVKEKQIPLFKWDEVFSKVKDFNIKKGKLNMALHKLQEKGVLTKYSHKYWKFLKQQ